MIETAARPLDLILKTKIASELWQFRCVVHTFRQLPCAFPRLDIFKPLNRCHVITLMKNSENYARPASPNFEP